MKLEPVKSSNIAAVGYSADTKLLVVAFNNGSVYGYQGVEPELAEDLRKAPSVGAFLHREIKSKSVPNADERTGQRPYVYRQLDDDDIVSFGIELPAPASV